MTNASDNSLGVITNVVVSVGEGDSKQDFNVPEFFAVKSSQFMQTALGGDWKESHEKRVSLPKVRVSDFEAYLQWLYTGHVVLLDRPYDSGFALLRLYLLGDFLVDDRFCNAVMDFIIRESGTLLLAFLSEEIDYVWNQTTPGSRMRRVLVDLIIRDLSGDTASTYFCNRGAWNSEVTAEVFARMAEFKDVALGMFAALEGPSNVQQSVKSAVKHPRDNENKCADYHKHSEGYPRCT